MWDAFETNYTQGKYQFAFLAYHMLTMSFVYFNIWQIMKTEPKNFAMSLIGFDKKHEGKFGETTRILDRCIVESSIKLAWLTSTNDPERFLRFLAKSLKSDLQLKAQIQRNIEKRLGQARKIEERMLRSIERYIADAGLTEDRVVNTAKLQDFATMISDIGIKDQLFYVVAQSMGSHHIHGNWTSLSSDYLGKTPEGTFVPRMEHVGMHINQYFSVPLVVILGMRSYVAWAMLDTPEKQNVLDFMVSLEKEIEQIVTLAIENDRDAEIVGLPPEEEKTRNGI